MRLPVFNAAALPGGVILVFTGTLEEREAVRDEAELAAVLGHEITHIERRHALVAAYQFARAALGDDADEAVLAMQVLTQPLSTEHELEADERRRRARGARPVRPRRVNLWKRRARSERRAPRGRPAGGVVGDVVAGLDTLLRSHPPAAVRACHAMERVTWAREHAPCARLYDGRTNLLTHVAGPRRPTDRLGDWCFSLTRRPAF